MLYHMGCSVLLFNESYWQRKGPLALSHLAV